MQFTGAVREALSSAYMSGPRSAVLAENVQLTMAQSSSVYEASPPPADPSDAVAAFPEKPLLETQGWGQRLAMNDIVFENTWPADAQPTPTAY